MTDEKLLKLVKYLTDESTSKRSDPWMMFKNRRVPSPTETEKMKNCKARTDIFLRCITNDDLNDLVTMVKVGKYNEYRKNDSAWKKAKENISFDDLSAWRKEIRAEKLSDDGCFEYLREMHPESVINVIHAYLSMKPMTERKQKLLRNVNKCRNMGRIKATRIEMR